MNSIGRYRCFFQCKRKNIIIPSNRSAGETGEKGGNEKRGEIKRSANILANTIFCLSDYLLNPERFNAS